MRTDARNRCNAIGLESVLLLPASSLSSATFSTRRLPATGELPSSPDAVPQLMCACRGPNATFRFPAQDGTGGIWKAVAKTLPQEKFKFNASVIRIEGEKKIAHLDDGSSIKYNSLVSTMALDLVVPIIEGAEKLKPVAEKLVYSSTHVIGVGVRGVLPPRIGNKCWLYLCDRCLAPFFDTSPADLNAFSQPRGRLALLPCHGFLQLLAFQLPSSRCSDQDDANRRPHPQQQRRHHLCSPRSLCVLQSFLALSCCSPKLTRIA